MLEKKKRVSLEKRIMKIEKEMIKKKDNESLRWRNMNSNDEIIKEVKEELKIF